MRLQEQKLWDRMREGVKRHAKVPISLERMETIVAGHPDVEIICKGVVTKVELKVARNGYPKRASTPVLGDDGLSVDQRNWFLKWSNHGGRGMIIVGIEGVDEHYAFRAHHADAINNFTRNDMHECAFLFMEGPAFWGVLLNHL